MAMDSSASRMEKYLDGCQELISSHTPSTRLKGLTQLEWYLTQICPRKKEDYNNTDYRHFYKLQQGFEYNVAVWVLDALADLEGDEDIEAKCVLTCLTLTQGAVLVHADSQKLFGRPRNMALLLALLDRWQRTDVQILVLHTLICVMVDRWDNLRIFEDLRGLEKVTTLLKTRSTAPDVRIKSLEFLYFYLLPEPDASASASASASCGSTKSPLPTTPNHRRSRSVSPSKYLSRPGSPRKGSNDSNASSEGGLNRRTSEAKQEILRGYIPNVDALVNQMSRFMPVDVVERVEF